MAEALLVTAVAVGFYLATTNPQQRGTLDYADHQTVAGWAVNEAQPWMRIEVQLYIDGRFIANKAADGFRPDVREAKRADDDWHGFVFPVPLLASGEHEVRVYAVYAGSNGARRNLQLIGKPRRFRVEDSVNGGGQR